ncbi:MAG: cytochrome c-550 PedF [Burkholderiaceae bacterium]|nr:cytochrome c-550 PedF [Burkholderiaceae bacterium]
MNRIGTTRWDAVAASLIALAVRSAIAHGDVTPQVVDTHTLKQLDAEWLAVNPYSGDPEALRVGASGFNQNCARCHGLEAISGGIAPDLRRLDRDCLSLASEQKKQQCFEEIDDYFQTTVRHGRTQNGVYKMPPFEGVLTQEAVWAIKTYLESRRVSE